MEIQERILNYLKEEKKGADVHKLLAAFEVDFKELLKALNALEDANLIYRDNKDIYHDLQNANIKEGVVIVRYNRPPLIDKEEGVIIDLNTAMHLDSVFYTRTKGGLKVLKILKRNSNCVIGDIYYYNHRYHFKADDERQKGFKITNFNTFKLQDHTKVRCIITDHVKKEMKIDTVIGHLDDPRINELAIVYKANVPMEFSSAVLKEAERLSLRMDRDDRKDLSTELVITIDGDSAKDFDDAISLAKDDEGYVLKVHIADVSYYVKEGSAIDRSALERGTSIYYTDQVIPMLPQRLSNDLCSLVEGQERYTLTVELHYDQKGQYMSSDFYSSIIRSRHRMTYKNVNLILKGDEKLRDKYSDIVGMLETMAELASMLRKWRQKAGAIDFDDDEAAIILDECGAVKDVQKVIRGESEHIIEDFMIEANVAIASYMHYLDYPMIYRNHDKPKQDRLKIFFELLESLDYKMKGNHYEVYPKQLQDCLLHYRGSELEGVVSNLLLRSMAKALYDDVSMGHFGLALSDYCHFTSPIRRYPDLMVHRLLKKYVFKANLDEYKKDKARMHAIAVKCSDCEKRATQIERDVSDVRKAEYMRDKVGEIYEGIISGVTSHGLYVRLDNTVEGLVALRSLDGYYTFDEKMMVLYSDHDRYHLGQKVKVQVTLSLSDKPSVEFILV